jgi:hypothetical protein
MGAFIVLVRFRDAQLAARLARPFQAVLAPLAFISDQGRLVLLRACRRHVATANCPAWCSDGF